MIDKTAVNGFTVIIDQDPDCPSPHDEDSLVRLALSHKNYALPNDPEIDPDDFDSAEAVITHLTTAENAVLVQTVRGYDHSGLSMSVNASYPYTDPWDSGVLGFAYITRESWHEAMGSDWTGSEEDLTQARVAIAGEVDTYSLWSAGDCYAYRVIDTDGEQVDECSGYIGYDSALEEATRVALSLTHDVKCNGTLNRRAGAIEHTGPCPLHGQAGEGDA